MGIRNISIKGFRRLSSVSLDLAPLTVLIGPNGAGKTSLLETISLLAQSAQGHLQDTLSQLGGINELTTRGKTNEIDLDVTMDLPNYEPLVYRLCFKTKGVGYEISRELLSQRNPKFSEPFKHIDSSGVSIKYFDPSLKKLSNPTWEVSGLETSLAQVPKMYNEAERFRKLLASCTYYSSYRLDLSHNAPIRLPQRMQPVSYPGRNGETLVSCLYNMRETDRVGFELIEATLSAAFPGFVRLNFPPVAAGTITLTWQEEHFEQPLYLNQLSEGTLRFLWLITLLHSTELPAIILIDEPEVSLHPQMISLLVDAMREASIRSRLIVATHSDRLIRFLKPEEIVATDLENGLARFTHGQDMNIEKWLADYSLDELWNMGLLGAKS